MWIYVKINFTQEKRRTSNKKKQYRRFIHVNGICRHMTREKKYWNFDPRGGGREREVEWHSGERRWEKKSFYSLNRESRERKILIHISVSWFINFYYPPPFSHSFISYIYIMLGKRRWWRRKEEKKRIRHTQTQKAGKTAHIRGIFFSLLLVVMTFILIPAYR